MKRKILLIAFILFGSVFLTSCFLPSIPQEQKEYEIWKNSDDAEDFNGDRKINETDYELYLEHLEYEAWKASEEAEDLNYDELIDEDDYKLYIKRLEYEIWKNTDEAEDFNGDRKINEEDYEIYLTLEDFESWRNSEEAEDLNGDRKINKEDYLIYLSFSEFVGNYQITNYSFIGDEKLYFENGDLGGAVLFVKDLGRHFAGILFSVDKEGNITADIPEHTIELLGESFAIINEGFNNMQLNRISPYIVALDTSVTVEKTVLNITLYLTENESGFASTYVLKINEKSSTIGFALVKVK